MASGEGTQKAVIAVPCSVSVPTGAALTSRVEGVMMVYPLFGMDFIKTGIGLGGMVPN
jgi:hypothetical protein